MYVIVNRRARGLRDDGPLLAEQCRARATAVVIETRTLEELDAAARRVAAAPAPVVLGGGDGSHGAGITALARAFAAARPGARDELPPIALAPGGTVNTVAKGWGMRGDAVAYTRRLLASVEAGAAARTRRPTLQVVGRKNRGLNDVAGSNARAADAGAGADARVDADARTANTNTNTNARDADAGADANARAANAGAGANARDADEGSGNDGDARVGFIFGAGLVARFFELYDAKGAPGLATAAGITARVFAGSFVGGELARRVLMPASCTLFVDGAPIAEDRLSLLCASVVEDVGLGLRLTYRAGESFARFHVVGTALAQRALGPQMTRVLRGLPLRGACVDALAASVELRFPAGTGAYVVDGELVRGDRVVVRAGPVLEVLEP